MSPRRRCRPAMRRRHPVPAGKAAACRHHGRCDRGCDRRHGHRDPGDQSTRGRELDLRSGDSDRRRRAAAARGRAALSSSCPATSTPGTRRPIYARVSGYVKRWYFDYGAHVKKGQVLAVIDTPDLDAQYAAAKATLNAARARVNVFKADMQFAKTTYARWRDSPQGVVSEQETGVEEGGLRECGRAVRGRHRQCEIGRGRRGPAAGLGAVQGYRCAVRRRRHRAQHRHRRPHHRWQRRGRG